MLHLCQKDHTQNLKSLCENYSHVLTAWFLPRVNRWPSIPRRIQDFAFGLSTQFGQHPDYTYTQGDSKCNLAENTFALWGSVGAFSTRPWDEIAIPICENFPFDIVAETHYAVNINADRTFSSLFFREYLHPTTSYPLEAFLTPWGMCQFQLGQTCSILRVNFLQKVPSDSQ